MMKEYWKTGEIARLAGLTIRTLRYYDQIQLFSPSEFTDSGHRLYTKKDLAYLQQILALKQMGLPLEDIKSVLAAKEKGSASDILEAQISRVQSDIQVQQHLLRELESALRATRRKGGMSVEELTELFGAMRMYQEKYFTKEQLDNMREYYEQFDEAALKKTEREFKMVLENIRAEKESGTPPDDSTVQALAQKWKEIVYAFTGHNQDLRRQAEKFHAENPDNGLQFGVDAEIYLYIQKALE